MIFSKHTLWIMYCAIKKDIAHSLNKKQMGVWTSGYINVSYGGENISIPLNINYWLPEIVIKCGEVRASIDLDQENWDENLKREFYKAMILYYINQTSFPEFVKVDDETDSIAKGFIFNIGVEYKYSKKMLKEGMFEEMITLTSSKGHREFYSRKIIRGKNEVSRLPIEDIVNSLVMFIETMYSEDVKISECLFTNTSPKICFKEKK